MAHDVLGRCLQQPTTTSAAWESRTTLRWQVCVTLQLQPGQRLEYQWACGRGGGRLTAADTGWRLIHTEAECVYRNQNMGEYGWIILRSVVTFYIRFLSFENGPMCVDVSLFQVSGCWINPSWLTSLRRRPLATCRSSLTSTVLVGGPLMTARQWTGPESSRCRPWPMVSIRLDSNKSFVFFFKYLAE